MRRELQDRVDQALEAVRCGVAHIDSTARRLKDVELTQPSRDRDVLVTVTATGVVRRIKIEPSVWEQYTEKQINEMVTRCVATALEKADLRLRQEQANAGARFVDLGPGRELARRPARRTGVLGGDRGSWR